MFKIIYLILLVLALFFGFAIGSKLKIEANKPQKIYETQGVIVSRQGNQTIISIEDGSNVSLEISRGK